jgi:predicted ArsR family transcriptional regulator
MSMKYAKITKEDVYSRMMSLSLDVMNPIGGAISLVNLAALLQTSRYQVKKHMDHLKELGYVELKVLTFPAEDEIFPPYWGYRLTAKGKTTEAYITEKKKREKAFEEFLNNESFSS